MLQYPVLRPLSSPKVKRSVATDHHHFASSNGDNTRNEPRPLTNKRVYKDAFVTPQYTGQPPPFPNFFSSRPNPTPSPTTASPKLPRNLHISSRQASIAVPVPRSASSKSPASSRPSSTIGDVLFPGDAVGVGAMLQGQVVRLVSIGANPSGPPDSPSVEEPAQEFEVVRRLGAGSYAVVYLVREVLYRPPPSEDGHPATVGTMDIDDLSASRNPSTVYGREFAVKCLSKANLDEEALAAQMSEATIHQSLASHPNIVTLYRTFETSSFLLLLLEYVPGEDLFYFLEQARDHYEADSPTCTDPSSTSSRTPPTPSLLSNLHPSQLLSRTRLRLISSMFSQMCDAVAACHAQQVYHRDIKPENFIVTDGWTTTSDGRQERKVIVKLTDFGLSTTDVESSDMDCGSAPYMSYECRNNVAPTYRPRAADVWSLGIVLINMLYHYNPWTDTSQGACNSFDIFRQAPVNFFTQRFTGMTRPVAEILANRVFNVLDDSGDDSKRISAADFGLWAKDLPDLLATPATPSHQRGVSISSTQGHPISSSVPPSHRPSSRQASNAPSSIRTPAIPIRSLSRAPSLEPAYERPEASELSTVIDQEVEEQEETEQVSTQGILMTSRSTSTNKRRKRGARKGKGATAATPTTPSPQDDTLATLAVASQSLAREISKASKAPSVTSSHKSKTSDTSSRRSRSTPYEPVSMYALPTPLLSKHRPMAAAPQPPSPTVPPPPNSVHVSTSTTSLHVPVKKPSKWKLSFGKASSTNLASAAANGRMSPLEEPSAPSLKSMDVSVAPMSATASNVTSLIMSLDAPVVHSTSVTDEPWGRGRRARGSRSPHGSQPSRSPNPPPLSHHQGISPNPSIERWVHDTAGGRSNRGVSPNSSRSGRPLASSSSSITSGNWRNSMSTTSSSAGTSTSAFTRYSNASVRSVSTTATSVSATSWRTGKGQPPPSSNSSTHLPQGVPKNVKIMDGVPWELDQLPRGQYPGPEGDLFGSPPARKQRSRKQPKDVHLDTISEDRRRDATTSTTSLGLGDGSGDEEGYPKKVQRGQINALAKMLSALRR